MKVQNNKGIYVYSADANKKLITFYFSTWEKFFDFFSQKLYFDMFANDWTLIFNSLPQDIKQRIGLRTYGAVYLCYHVACDEEGNVIPYHAILDAYEAERKRKEKERKRSTYNRFYNGRRRRVYGSYHSISVARSRRALLTAHDIDDVDGVRVKVRSKSIPLDSWEVEKFQHVEKNWKSQRKHQWK